MNDFNIRMQDDDNKFVDIHGREITTISVGKNNEAAFPLSELKQTGVGIYQKSQYAKLSAKEKDFDGDFINYMLESAKSYMLNNKISFSQEQIIRSIENCKTVLSGNRTATPQPSFLKNRSIEKRSDDEILIQVKNTPEVTPPSTGLPRKSPIMSPQQLSFLKETKNTNLKIEKRQNRNEKSLQSRKHDMKNRLAEQQNQIVESGDWSSSSSTSSGSIKKNFNSGKPKPNKKNSPAKSREGPPEVRPPKGKFSYDMDAEEHDVVVTQIDKPNCIWVRDKVNDELLNSVHVKINEEATFQKVAPKPWEMDKVYMAQDEGCWFRCKITKFTPLTVFFLDYGNVAEVNEIKEVSDEMAKIPCLAVRITFKVSEYEPRLEDEIRMKRFMRNKDGTFFVNILKSPLKPANKTQSYFTRPPYFSSPQDRQSVVIMREKNGLLYLRTRECFEKMKEIEKAIENYVKTAGPVQNVKVNQLVLCQRNKDKFDRAIVTKVHQTGAEIELLDYLESSKVELKMLKTISEELSREPITYCVGGKLAGFQELEYDEAAKAVIGQHIEKRKKFRLELGFDDEIDLFDGTQLLSEQLKEEVGKRVLLQDIKPYKPEFGIKPYLCGCYRSSSDFALVPSEELQNHIDYVLRSEIEDDEPYSPTVKEVCLCFYVDQWYRCVVSRILNSEYEVLLLDFGNVEIIKKENLRKLDEQSRQVPPLALPCKLIGLPKDQNVEDLLKNIIIEGEIYNVDVKCIDEGKCQVEIPSVYQKIKDNCDLKRE